jgi:hypothetical protein
MSSRGCVGVLSFVLHPVLLPQQGRCCIIVCGNLDADTVELCLHGTCSGMS